MSLLPAICIIVLYISTCVIYMNCLSYVPIILAMFMSDFSDFISACVIYHIITILKFAPRWLLACEL